MKIAVLILVGFVAVNASFFGDLTDKLSSVGSGVLDALKTVGHSLEPVGNMLLETLKTAGPDLLKTAVQTGIQALPAVLAAGAAAGKRDLSESDIKDFIQASLHEEYQKWLSEIESKVHDSKQELVDAIEKYGFDNLPQEMKDYVAKYIGAHLTNNVPSFIKDMAEGLKKEALAQLPKRLNDKLASVLSEIKKHI